MCSTVTSSKYSISAASRITGKSRTTISKHIRSGKLSCGKDEDGNKVIDGAELLRVYGDVCAFENAETSQPPRESKQATQEQTSGDSGTVQSLHEKFEREAAERKRERDQLQEQIEYLKAALEKSQEGHNRATLLLQQQREGQGGWQDAIKAMDERLANRDREAEAKLTNMKRQLVQYRQALEEERSKGFWKRLFG